MNSKLIVALDVDSYERATTLVHELAGEVDVFKVGSQLFTRVGPKIIEFIHKSGKKVFLDLKFHDIPNTVAKAVESAAALRVFMLTLHVSGGAEMLLAAAKPVSGRPLLLGVTVLTSVAGDVDTEAMRRAKLAKECGLDGVVASPQEVRLLRESFGERFLIVAPGIRPAWAQTDDQKRVMTPREAVDAGASYIVVGRPIVDSEQPAKAAKRIAGELA